MVCLHNTGEDLTVTSETLITGVPGRFLRHSNDTTGKMSRELNAKYLII